MMDIKNKETRSILIERYLNAEISLAEEKILVDYFISNEEIDEDEQAVAKMIKIEKCHAFLLSDEGVQEYGRIVKESKRKTKKIYYKWGAWIGGVAASIVLFCAIYPITTASTSDTVEIAQCIQLMMNMEDMVSITATPVDNYVWVRAELNDGSTEIFIMNKNDIDETTSLLTI